MATLCVQFVYFREQGNILRAEASSVPRATLCVYQEKTICVPRQLADKGTAALSGQGLIVVFMNEFSTDLEVLADTRNDDSGLADSVNIKLYIR